MWRLSAASAHPGIVVSLNTAGANTDSANPHLFDGYDGTDDPLFLTPAAG